VAAADSGVVEEVATTTIRLRHTRLVGRRDRSLRPAHHGVLVRLIAVLASGLELALVLQEAIWLANIWQIELSDKNRNVNEICLELDRRIMARVVPLGSVEVVEAVQQQGLRARQVRADTSLLDSVVLGVDNLKVTTTELCRISVSILPLRHLTNSGPGFRMFLLEIFVLDESADQ
jgi:hypothetical protein